MNYEFINGQVKTTSMGVIMIFGSATTSTSGTLASSQVFGGGASIAKTAAVTGRYTITLAPPAGAAIGLSNYTFLGGMAAVVGPDTAAMTTTKGLLGVFRDDDISIAGTKDGTVELSWVTSNSGNADTELEDGAKFFFWLAIGSPSVT